MCNTHGRIKGMNVDRLEILKTKCEQEVRETEDRLRVLKAKLANLIALAQESEKLANPESEPDKYNETGLTDAVYDAIKSLWEARKVGASATEIKNHLLAHGFQAGENFDTAIYTVLTRLCESDKVARHSNLPPPRRPRISLGGITRHGIQIPRRLIYRPK